MPKPSFVGLAAVSLVCLAGCGGDVAALEDASMASEISSLDSTRQEARSFVESSVDWMTTAEWDASTDGVNRVRLGGSQGESRAPVINGMRNAMRWTKSDLHHQLEAPSNLSMCMTTYVLAQVYPHVPEKQPVIERQLQTLQRAILATQERRATALAQFGFPASPAATQFSAKTNAVCGLAFLELAGFWSWRASAVTDAHQAASLWRYRDDARSAAVDVKTFLSRLQDPKTLPGMPGAHLNLSSLPDGNGDGHYDGVFDEIVDNHLVMSTAMWSAMSGRFFQEMSASPGFSLTASERMDLRARAAGMRAFYAHGLSVAGEHFSPRFACQGADCVGKFSSEGTGIAYVEGFSAAGDRVQGGDGKWHGRVASPKKHQYADVDGSDSPQWAFNALYALDSSASSKSESGFDLYWSPTALQAAKGNEGVYPLLGSAGRDIFLGLGTFILHGRVENGTFVLDPDGRAFAHFVKASGGFQIVTSSFGDNAVSGWAPGPWAKANQKLFHDYDLQDSAARVEFRGDGGSYDFGARSHLAHWAMTLDEHGGLQPLDNGVFTVSAENMASTVCRALRVWQGRADACSL